MLIYSVLLCGATEIRTRETLLTFTRFPEVAQPLQVTVNKGLISVFYLAQGAALFVDDMGIKKARSRRHSPRPLFPFLSVGIET